MPVFVAGGNNGKALDNTSLLFNKARAFQNHAEEEFPTPSNNSVACELIEGKHQNDGFSSEEEPSIDKDIDERYLVSEGTGPSKDIKNEPGRGGGCFSVRNFNEQQQQRINPLTPPSLNNTNFGKKSMISNNGNDCQFEEVQTNMSLDFHQDDSVASIQKKQQAITVMHQITKMSVTPSNLMQGRQSQMRNQSIPKGKTQIAKYAERNVSRGFEQRPQIDKSGQQETTVKVENQAFQRPDMQVTNKEERPSLLDYLKRQPSANSSFKSMNDPSLLALRNKKYNHQWVTLSQKYDIQKPPKGTKGQTNRSKARGNENQYQTSDSFGRASKAKTRPALNAIDTQLNHEARQLRECTFSPKINSSKAHPKRSLEEFLKSQQDHLDRSKNKIESLRCQQIKLELAEVKVAEQYKSVSPRALEKLYQDGQKYHEKKQMLGEEIYRKLSPFSPRLVAKQTSQDRDYNTLYQDAMRRVQSPKVKDSLVHSPNGYKSTTRRNNSYLRKRFMNDYDLMVTKKVEQPITTFEIFLEVLRELNYIKPVNQSKEFNHRHNQEPIIKNRLQIAYRLLNHEGEITHSNLRTFLQAVHGINSPKDDFSINRDSISQLNGTQSQRDFVISPDLMRPSIATQSLNIGSVNEDGVYIVPDRHSQLEIMKLFMFMHDNKQEHVTNLMKQEKQPFLGSRSGTRLGPDTSMFSFKPQIVNKSRNLAENYKKTFADRLTNIMQTENSLIQAGDDNFQPFNNFQTMKQPLCNDTTVHTFNKPQTAFEHLYQHASYQTIKQQQQLRERQSQLQKEEQRECTFKPQIILSSETREWGESVRRQLKQYEERKKARADKSTEEVEYERGKKECTFKPTISQFKGTAAQGSFGYQQSQGGSRKNTMTSRSRTGGQNTNQKGGQQDSRLSNYQPLSSNKKVNMTSSEIEPLLVANIQIGQSNQQTARLVIYDANDIPEVVAKFCQQHSLNEEVTTKLRDLIQTQISQADAQSQSTSQRENLVVQEIFNERKESDARQANQNSGLDSSRVKIEDSEVMNQQL